MVVTSTSFVTTAQANTWINLAIAELREFMIAEMGDDWLAKAGSNSVTSANVDLYALPADCFKPLGVDVSFDNGLTWRTCDRFEFADRNRWQGATAWGFYNLPRYRLYGANVMFRPIPATVVTYRLWYIPSIARLVNDSDTYDFVNGWDDWVACRVAIRMLQKEESDASALSADLMAIMQRIVAAVRHRDAGTPKRMQDTSRLSSRGAWSAGPDDESSWS